MSTGSCSNQGRTKKRRMADWLDCRRLLTELEIRSDQSRSRQGESQRVFTVLALSFVVLCGSNSVFVGWWSRFWSTRSTKLSLSLSHLKVWSSFSFDRAFVSLFSFGSFIFSTRSCVNSSTLRKIKSYQQIWNENRSKRWCHRRRLKFLSTQIYF